MTHTSKRFKAEPSSICEAHSPGPENEPNMIICYRLWSVVWIWYHAVKLQADAHPSQDPSGLCTFLQYSSPSLRVDLKKKWTSTKFQSFIPNFNKKGEFTLVRISLCVSVFFCMDSSAIMSFYKMSDSSHKNKMAECFSLTKFLKHAVKVTYQIVRYSSNVCFIHSFKLVRCFCIIQWLTIINVYRNKF